MNRLWSDKIRNVMPYVAGEQPKNKNIIKLNANENPYPPSPKVEEDIKALGFDNLRLYPDASVSSLKSSLANFYNIQENEIFVGNGSDDVIALAFMAFFNSNVPILFPEISYSFYKVWCALFNTPYEMVPLKKDFTIDPNDYTKNNGGIILPNPNAPTGIGESKDFIISLLESNRNSIVIIDEAYVDFGAYSAVELINMYDNLVVIHTFSKSRSLAGLRIGIAMANSRLINVLETIKNSYNSYTVNTISMTAARASIEDNNYFRSIVSKIISTRANTVNSLKCLGFSVLPSSANFVFVTHKTKKAEDIFGYLKSKDIYVRHFSIPKIDNYLRITIGTDDEMEKLLCTIKEYLN